MRVPPPLYYLAAFALGLLVERACPVGIQAALDASAPAALAIRVVGGLAIALGVVLGPANAIRFLLRGTTLNPTRQANVFLTDGIYRLSRNPMYLGLFLIYAGAALMNAKLWPLVTAIIPFLLLDRIVIPFEEEQMAERFGAPFSDYCVRVGRWLGAGKPR